ncbi:MAG: hypothetical protein ACT4PT_06255 [Methanobacteriota archaeon]
MLSTRLLVALFAVGVLGLGGAVVALVGESGECDYAGDWTQATGVYAGAAACAKVDLSASAGRVTLTFRDDSRLGTAGVYNVAWAYCYFGADGLPRACHHPAPVQGDCRVPLSAACSFGARTVVTDEIPAGATRVCARNDLLADGVAVRSTGEVCVAL